MKQKLQNRRVSGLSLVEVLIALAVFATVMALAYAAIVNGLSTHSNQEASVGAQAKLRRIVEVVSQDIRSAVFGSILDTPYSSDTNSVSFLLLTGGAGYALEEYTMGDTQISILSSSTAALTGRPILVVNQVGVGVLARVNHVSNMSGTRRLTLNCGVPVPHTTNTLLFEVGFLGVSYDAGRQEIDIRTSDSPDATPLAFDIADFRVDYIYTAEGEEPIVQSTPHRVGGVQEPTMDVSGTDFNLSRLQFVVSTDAESMGRTQRHSYSAQVDLLSNQDFKIRELTTCL